MLKKVVDLDLDRPRPVTVAPELLTGNIQEILDDPEIDIIVELIGGTTAAYGSRHGCFGRGKHVVTANKALLALHGNEVFRKARQAGVEVGFEASVCGGIPINSDLAPGIGSQCH